MRTLTICGTPIAAFTIVIPTLPDPAEKRAAEFLQRVISTSCGVTLPITDKPVCHSIVLGFRETDPAIKYDGFRIASDDAHLYLYGNMARGTLYAAYDFAETYLGYRYFADDCEVIPTDGEADVPAGLNHIDNPAFAARRTSCEQHVHSAEMSSHSRLNDCTPGGGEGYGGVEPANGECHSFWYLCPAKDYFEEHPEYYSYYVDEETGVGRRLPVGNDYVKEGQLCLSNPDVLRIVTENVLKKLRANPGLKIAEVSQCDNRHYCQCEKCAAIDAEEGGPSGSMIRFVNAVAEAVEKEFPDVLVRTFAYQYTRKPPKITKARHNVLVRYCTIEACFRHAIDDPDCPWNGHVFGDELKEWSRMAHQISIWDYITNWACYSIPYPNFVALRANARFFAENHAIHVLEECNDGTSGGIAPELKAYLVGKLLWDPYMSEEEYEGHIKEFLRAFYGKGWQAVGRALQLDHECTKDRHMGTFDDADWGRYAPELVHRPDYTPLAYQNIFDDHRLIEFSKHLPEIKADYDRAFALAETDTEREHLERSRFSISYVDLFLTRHEKDKMTEEEQKAYEAEVEKFYRDKERFGVHYNIDTSLKGR